MRNIPLILVADDDVGFQEILATKLKRNGFLVAEAHDGAETVEKAKNLLPDLRDRHRSSA
jgi:CheY-like chemotaxis protein